jgi:hypothetical protein
MYAGLIYIPLILAGMGAICWGLPAAHRLARPMDIAASLAVLAGVILTVLGALLVVIPNFFR